ncbi:MAG: hypothetical protein J7M19_01045 [Planctomycetes bacterium]|nr:hypothetical protein [Planctomycetota bacterium]
MKYRNNSPDASKEAPCKPPRYRCLLRKALVVLAGGLALFAVMLLWRPEGADSTGPTGSFISVLMRTEIPRASGEISAYGAATLTLREAEIAALAAALQRDDSALGPPVADAVGSFVPAWITAVSGCRIRRDGLTVYLACRKGVSFYVTLEGRLVRGDDGRLDFELTCLKVGLVPIPLGLAGRLFNLEDVVIIDPDCTGLHVERLVTHKGRITLYLEDSRRNL